MSRATTSSAAIVGLLSLLARGASAQTTTSAATAAATSTGSAAVVVSGTSVAAGATTAAVSINSALPQTPLYTPTDGYSIPPLSEIVATATNEPATIAATTTYAAGVTPTHIPNAPPIPSSYPVPANFPPLDVHAAPNSTQVQQWLSELDLSDVPNLSLTNGSCATSPEAAADPSRCWWTCGGCTRATDIVDCPTKYDWGLSYDDGPSPWTPALLEFFAEKNITSTFFVVGSRVVSRPQILIDEYMSGHQIAVHTWSHPYLTTLSNEQIVAELGWSKKVIHDTIGVTPAFFRPPYGDIDDRVRSIAAKMGLTPIIWTRANGQTFDTTDWNIPGGTATGESSLGRFEEILNLATQIDNGFIVLEHDLWPQTIDLALGYVLPMATNSSSPYKLKDINTCLSLPPGNAYIETSNNATVITQSTTWTSTQYPASIGTGSASVVTAASGTASGAGSSQSSGSSSGGSSNSKSGALASIEMSLGVRGVAALAAVALTAAFAL